MSAEKDLAGHEIIISEFSSIVWLKKETEIIERSFTNNREALEIIEAWRKKGAVIDSKSEKIYQSLKRSAHRQERWSSFLASLKRSPQYLKTWISRLASKY